MSENSVTRTGDEANRDAELESVIADYIRACDAGVSPNQQAILERHPELADDLREFFAQRDHLNQLAGPIRAFGDSVFQSIGPGKHISYVGDYELLEEVARGGMGVVYKARQKTLGRIVAVKMMLTGRLANEDDVKRFQIEAQAAASLQHPNIVPIHEVGQHEGLHYFSMDFVEGRSLSAVLRENVLPAKQAASYVRQMAEAIHYAHQQGTLHRDLKPSNVLIDSRDQVRITDFGLAMRVEGDSGLTQTGQIVGTPSYMPPEQAQGKRSLIGPGSDVYSLGAILYECLTGRAPFRADSVMKTIEQVIHREAASPRLLNPGVARDLETICLKCLEKEPHRRYGTAQLLADDLQRYLDDRPILARPVGAIERTWRWCRRNPTLAGMVVLLAVLVVLSASFVTRGYYNEQLKSTNATLERTVGQRDAALSLAAAKQVEVDGQHRRAVEAEKQTRQFMYSAHILLATKAVEADDPKHAYELLAPFRTDDSSIRGPEWDILWRRIKGEQYSLTTSPGSRADVRCIQYHPDGQQLVTGSDDGTVTVWHIAENKPRYFIRHPSPIQHVCFLHRGSGITFVDKAGSLFHYAPDARSAVRIGGSFEFVTSLHAWPRDGVIASCHLDGTVRTTKTPNSENRRASEPMPDVAACPAVNHDGQLSLWRDGDTQPTQLADLKIKPASPYFAANSDVAVISVQNADQRWQLVVVRIRDGIELGRIDFVDRELRCLAVSPSGHWIGVGGTHHRATGESAFLQIFNIQNLAIRIERECRPGKSLDCLAFRGDSRQLAGSVDGSIELWEVANDREVRIESPASRATLAFNPESTQLATIHEVTRKARIVLRNSVTGEEQHSLDSEMYNLYDVAFDRSGKTVAAAGYQGVETWDIETRKSQRIFAAKHQCFRVKLEPMGIHVAGSGGGTTVWNRSTGQIVYESLIDWDGGRTAAGDWNTGLAFSPDGRRLAIAKRFGEVLILDTRTWEKRSSFISDFWIYCLTFSPDGKTLVGCGHDPHVWFWNPDDGSVVKTLMTTEQNRVDDVVFSDDGRRLVLGHRNTSATIWSAVTDSQLLSVGVQRPQTGGFCTVALTRDGTRLATNNGRVTIW